MDQAFLDRIDNVNEAIPWSDIIPGAMGKGTIQCPFCLKKGKGYLYEHYFKCFSSRCGEKGSKVSIYQKLNNMTFIEALNDLEDKSNLDFQTQQDEFDKRNEILSEVLDVYVNELWLNKHKGARDYLMSRGFDLSFIEQEQVGYAASTSVLREYGLNLNALRRHDFVRRYGDFFNNRIMFPVYNTRGYLVHMTGRFYPGETDEWKYLDSPMVPIIGSCKDYLLFEKHLPLYKNNGDVLFLVEGVPDSYILKQCGANVVGLMGLQKILRQTNKLEGFKKIIAVFDNDRFELDHPHYPGELKSWRVVMNQLIDLQIYFGSSVEIHTAMVPEGMEYNNKPVKDVNDLYLCMNKHGGNVISFLKDRATDIVEQYIKINNGDVSTHKTALKLIAATGRGRRELDPFIPEDWTPLEYALKVLSH